METLTTVTAEGAQRRWRTTRSTALGISLVATFGGIAGFVCARLLWA